MIKSLLRKVVIPLVLVSVPLGLAAQSTAIDDVRIVEVEVPAPSLDNNLLGTSNVQNAAVYLPPSYRLEPDHRFPVVYLLHGIFDDYEVWTQNYEVPSILDRLMSSGEIPEFIAVMPNGGNRYGGGYYRNSPVSGNWADYIATDLVRFVDANWRTLQSPESRGLIGHSMGGYGALHLAMHRSDVFSVIWALSPCCLAPTEDLSFGNDAWRRAAGIESPEDIQALIDSRDFYPIAMLGIVTAFSPDTEKAPIHGEFPFNVVRNEIVLKDTSFDAYLDAFPIRQVRGAREELRGLRGLGMGVGLADQFLHIPAGTLEMSQRLGSERIPHVLDVYAGDHREHVGERLEKRVFPWVGERLVLAE